MKIFITLFLLYASLSGIAVEPWLVIAGRQIPLASFEIVTPAGPSATEAKAAAEFRQYIAMVTGIALPIREGDAPVKYSVYIGKGDGLPSSSGIRRSDPDGFVIRVQDDRVLIAGGSGNGTLYGVYEFLERFTGCRFWAPGCETVPTLQAITLPITDTLLNPAFRSREVYYAGMDGEDFTSKMRCDRHAWKGRGNWGLWVHTMFTLVPPEKYFENHPDYYALMGGKRTATQLCLSNPEVLKVTIAALGEKMGEKPECRYWSVSQMDTYGNCECGACRAIDSIEGSPSGSMISFVNKVAAAFPEKVISTLAYQYTRKPPKYIRPAANVNIMLCTIECDRNKPLESDTSAGSFTRDLANWSAISGDIMVWDYVIQFTNMIGPFPNIPVLQPNIRLFRKYNVKAVFEQGCHGTYSENQELRQYLLSKLLWNPDLNVDSLISQFLSGYYGAASTYIRQYLNMMEQSLAASGKGLWIYGSPMQETDSFLSPGLVGTYNTLFNFAEQAVTRDTILLDRVRKARLPLRYATIEIAKKNITGPEGFMEHHGTEWKVSPGMIDQVNEFVALAVKYEVKTVHERSLPPVLYGEQTIAFFNEAYSGHLAKGKPYQLAAQPSVKYSAEGAGSLTDGKRGSPNYYVLWQGFEEEDLVAVVDLGKKTTINYVGAEFLQDLASWIFYPQELLISVSEDGNKFTDVAGFDSLSYTDPVLIRETGMMIKPVNARFVRFRAKNTGRCPAWHIGHGGKAWLFADELIADMR